MSPSFVAIVTIPIVPIPVVPIVLMFPILPIFSHHRLTLPASDIVSGILAFRSVLEAHLPRLVSRNHNMATETEVHRGKNIGYVDKWEEKWVFTIIVDNLL
jgi:hypothetical protein